MFPALKSFVMTQMNMVFDLTMVGSMADGNAYAGGAATRLVAIPAFNVIAGFSAMFMDLFGLGQVVGFVWKPWNMFLSLGGTYVLGGLGGQLVAPGANYPMLKGAAGAFVAEIPAGYIGI